MNILDTFFFMFQADTTGVEKGAKSGDDAAKKLKKTLDDTDLSAKRLSENFVGMAKNAVNALAGVLALGAMKSLVNDTAAHTAAVALQARAINMNVEQLSAYQRALVSVGGNADDAAGTLGKLRSKFVEMSRFGGMTGPDAFMFRQLGLSAKEMQDSIKDPTIALGALADKFQTLNQTQRLYIGEKLGLDQGTIALLGQGRRAFDELIAKQKELGVVTQAQADASLKYRIAQAELGYTFETVKREIVTALLPAFTAIVSGLDKGLQWMREHKAVAIGLFGAIGAVIAVAVVPPLITAAAAMWAFIAPIIAAAAPFVLLGLAIGLVVDDIEKFRAGQKSVIGEIFERWPNAGKVILGVFDTIKASLMTFLTVCQSVWDYFAALLEFFSTVITKGPSAALETLNQKTSQILGNIMKAFGGLWGGVKEIGSGVVGGLKNLFTMGGDPKNGNAVPSGAAAAAVAATGVAAASAPPAAVARLGNTAQGKEIADKLVASGKWTREQAAGIAGSFMQESRGRADIENPYSHAYGLGQWLGSRVKDFEAFAGKPLRGSTLDDQIAFFNYETEHKEKRAGDRIRATSTAEDAAVAHAKYYERPGANEINLERRRQYATQINAGQAAIASTNNALALTPPTNGVSNRQVNVTTGPVSIHTPATDPAAHAAAFTDTMRQHYNDAMDQHDDGVLL
jgi:hypothetical protein